jgi:hypothetical protein
MFFQQQNRNIGVKVVDMILRMLNTLRVYISNFKNGEKKKNIESRGIRKKIGNSDNLIINASASNVGKIFVIKLSLKIDVSNLPSDKETNKGNIIMNITIARIIISPYIKLDLLIDIFNSLIFFLYRSKIPANKNNKDPNLINEIKKTISKTI